MGCENEHSVKTNNIKEKEKTFQEDPAKKFNIPLYEAISNSETKFKDMEETRHRRYIGIGVKKIPNYKCQLPYDKLEELREEFWIGKNQTDKVWAILRKCCEVDGETAEKILKEANQIVVERDMRQTYSRYQPNFIYHVPNFCICDPYYEKDFDGYEKLYNEVDDRIIKIKILYKNNNKEYDIKIRNKCTGFDLKHLLARILDLDSRENNFRIIYKGQEILDTHCMYYHNLKDNEKLYVLSTIKGNNRSRSKKRTRTRSNTFENTRDATKVEGL